MEYKASLDRFSKIVTILGIPLAILISVTVMFFNPKLDYTNPKELMPIILVVSIIISTYLITYLFSIRKYIVDSSSLTIVRPFKDIVIEKNNIKEVVVVDPDDMKWTIRTFGNGGLFGYYGKFYNNKLGRMTWNATQRKNYVLLTLTGNKKIIITPDDLSIVESLKSKYLN